MQKENILGIDVCVSSKEELAESVREDIEGGRQKFIVAINPEKILKAKKDKDLADLLNSADYQIPDGVGVIIASILRKGSIKQRITGIDSMQMLCTLAEKRNYSIFMYGAKPDVVEKAKEKLEEKHSGIKIVGLMDGYCENNDHLIDMINMSGANIIFVALGSPKQEYWIIENMHRLEANMFQGVGGSFDVICGNIKRAPRIMQKMGLEWLFRLIRQPSRIFRQIKLLNFLFLLIKDGRKKI